MVEEREVKMKVEKGIVRLKYKDGTEEDSRHIKITGMDGSKEDCKRVGQAILDWLEEGKQKLKAKTNE